MPQVEYEGVLILGLSAVDFLLQAKTSTAASIARQTRVCITV